MVDRSDDDLRSDGFLSRWARRKQDVLAGKPVAEPVVKPNPVQTAPGVQNTSFSEENKPIVPVNRAQAATDNIANADTEKTSELPPPPTLQDAGALTPASDFKPFMASNVSSEVKNAAMKKLFADPHYNVMDMMDTYVDDYSKPDPIPESMLKQLVSAKFLRLFERDEEEEGAKDGQRVNGKPVPPAQAPEPLTDLAAGADADSMKTTPVIATSPEALLPAPSDVPQGLTPHNALASTTQSKLPLKPHTP